MSVDHIPVSIAKKGLTDKYIELVKERERVSDEVHETRRVYNYTLRQLFTLTHTKEHRGLGVDVIPAYISGSKVAANRNPHDIWSHAIMIQEISNQLPELAGRWVEANTKSEKIHKDILNMQGDENR